MNGVDRSQFYGRMFPPTAVPVDSEREEDLKCLGKAMKDAAQRSGAMTPDSGFTYFGQFIDHDLTYDTTQLGQRSVEPNAVRNFRNARLDLELIYGGGPPVSPHLYEDDRVRLKIGRTAPSVDGRFPGGTLRDIGRKEDHTPLHADPNDTRNMENLIVMQIHVLFMKFHNAAVDQLEKNKEAFKSLPLSSDIFERAQQLVRWHYQWLVRKSFLPKMALGEVLEDVRSMDATRPKLKWHEEGLFIPAEFSMAAFRFGHSMVRAQYDVNCHRSGIKLVDLMAGGDPPEPLREDWLMEWGRLFKGLLHSKGGGIIPSSPINTSIAEPLHHLPEYTRRKFSDQSEEPQPRQLSARTLLRGARAGLPSGQEVAENLVRQGLLNESDVLRGKRLTAPADNTNDFSGSLLASSWMVEQTPLYYYLLKEAEALGGANNTLGPVGSRIIGEVIEKVLRADSSSYLNTNGLGPDWVPPALWQFRDGSGPAAINSFVALVQMLGDDLPQGCDPTFLSKVTAGKAIVTRRLVSGVNTIWRAFRSP